MYSPESVSYGSDVEVSYCGLMSGCSSGEP